MSLKRETGIPIPIEKDPAKTVVTPENTVPVKYHSQGNRKNWCWAACARMIFQHFGFSSDSQCTLAGKAYGPDCCSAPLHSGCDSDGVIAGCFFKQEGFAFCWDGRSFSYQEVVAQLQQNRPVKILWAQGDDDQGHYAVIVGNVDSSFADKGQIWVFDPRDTGGKRLMDYAEVLDETYEGKWVETYSQLDRRPETCPWDPSWCV